MSLEDRILFVDGEAIVIDKPEGLPVDAPRAGGDSIEARINELSLGFKRPPVPMHRLDRDTSGCLLLARNPRARAVFQQAFEGGTVTKSYLAVLDGVVSGDEGLIELPIAKVSSARGGWRMVPDDSGKPSATRWRRIAEADGQSLVELQPLSGRTHQLRVHAARGLGAAIVGDPVYSLPDDAELGGMVLPDSGMLLHAWRLVVPRDPKAAIDVTAPVPDRFGRWLDYLP
ncbi:RNA pseudouridine synthase [Sphingomonas sp. RB56-2]|jgi:tRNA pseudouridine32 synthase/23S rRNA pseudouridine746 synthase|uniref:RNA pseudouridine synthase n=1 Tax=Sphingomonas brevis TaxID=2908206 RepID=A0ABT0S686_9SPHN|nr:RNA pseudouridine synthase [Sphingomonas brevis]MCL6739641.1 RNA pseudouridine synthase [Sphingomonas brevis]